jgi:hypothetical protein
VLEREVQLFGARLEPTLERAVIRGLDHLILALVGLLGVVCLIAATVTLLHAKLAWWQAFGATGIILVLIAIVSMQWSRTSAAEPRTRIHL